MLTLSPSAVALLTFAASVPAGRPLDEIALCGQLENSKKINDLPLTQTKVVSIVYYCSAVPNLLPAPEKDD